MINKKEKLKNSIKYWSDFYNNSLMKTTKSNLTLMIKEAENELSKAEGSDEKMIKPEFRVIIAGSRNFNNIKFLTQNTDKMLTRIKDHYEIVIVSGGANGADQIGEKYAEARGYRLEKFPANWEKYGKSAGPIRNNEMKNYVLKNKNSEGRILGGCLVFTNKPLEESKGSLNMYATAKKVKIPTKNFVDK